MLYSELKENEIWKSLPNDEILLGNPEITKIELINAFDGINPEDIILDCCIDEYGVDMSKTIYIRNADKNNLMNLFKLRTDESSIESNEDSDNPQELSKGYTNIRLWWD